MRRPILVAVLVLLPLGAAPAAPPPARPAPAEAPSTAYQNPGLGISLRGPAGWTKEFEGSKASGTWIDLVAYREPKTRAYLLVSYQASIYSGSEEMQQKLTAYYRGLSDITILRGPEAQPAVLGVRDSGLCVEFARIAGKRTDRSLLAYYLNGRFTVRIYGTVEEKGHPQVQAAFDDFLRNVHFSSRVASKDRPNFIDEQHRYALLFPDGWTVHLPAKGPSAIFTGESLGVAIWVYQETWIQDLRAYRSRRLQDLSDAGTKDVQAPDPATHEKRGEPVLVLDYAQGAGADVKRYREVCVKGGDSVYRFVLGASAAAFPRGEPALAAMVETFRVR